MGQINSTTKINDRNQLNAVDREMRVFDKSSIYA